MALCVKRTVRTPSYVLTHLTPYTRCVGRLLLVFRRGLLTLCPSASIDHVLVHVPRSHDCVPFVFVVQGRDSKQWIQEVKFSADGATFAVGSHDNIIYLYDARGGRCVTWIEGRLTVV